MIPALVVLFQLQAGPPDPRSVVAHATSAIEGDSAARLSREWSARARKDSTDWAARLGLATLARLSYDYPAADSGYQSLARSADPRAAPFVIVALIESGRGLQIRGMNAAADSAYQRAADAAKHLGQRDLEGGALVALASVRARTFGVPAAEALLSKAGTLIPPDDLLGQSELRCGRAALLQMSGRPLVETEAYYGADLARRAGSVRQRAYCERIRALAILEKGDLGFTILRQVVDDLTVARDRAALASVLQWRGYRNYLGFDYGAARNDLIRAVAEGDASGARSVTAWALLDLTQLAAWSDDLVSARQYGDSAEVLFQSQGDRWGLGVLRATQGQVAYVGGDLRSARMLLMEALSAAERTGYPAAILGIQVGLALLEMDEGRLPDAERWLDRARRLAHASHLPQWENGLTVHYARLALLRNQPALAIRQLEADIRQSVGQPAVEYQARVRMATAFMRQGNAGAAEHELRRASDVLDSMRTDLADPESRRVVLQSLRDIRDPHLGLPQVLAGLVAAGRTDAAFELAERWKGRTLLDRLLLREALDSRAQPAPAAKALAVHTGPISVPDLVGALPEHTAILEYVTGAEGAPTTLFVLTRSGVTAHRLVPFDSLSADVRRFMSLVEAGEDPRELGKKVGMALLGPAIDRLPPAVTNLLIVPDVGLHRLAFDALELAGGRLAERFSISLAPSAAVAERLWTLPAHTGVVGLLALGDPRFAGEVAAGSEAVVYREAFGANGGLPRLPASAGEARAVARYAPAADVRLRDRASESYLKHTDLRRFRVLHFAAHALVDEQSPMRTALALAPGEGEDGFVTAGDLAALKLDADLVVLSACRTAGGAFVRGEGVEGLTAPLIEAGARGVVASLWRVGDQTAAEFVERFYAELGAGLPTGEALAAAKRESIRRGLPPSVWAAFTLVGDPSIRIPLREPVDRTWLAVGLGSSVLVIAYGLVVFRRRMAERT